MRRNRFGGAACGEAAGRQSVPREGWYPVPCVGDGDDAAAAAAGGGAGEGGADTSMWL